MNKLDEKVSENKALDVQDTTEDRGACYTVLNYTNMLESDLI